MVGKGEEGWPGSELRYDEAGVRDGGRCIRDGASSSQLDVEVAGVRIPLPELHRVERCLTYRYPVLRVAVFTGVVELLIAAPFAAAYGSALMIGAGMLSAAGMAIGAWTDHLANPRFMAIEATVRGRRVVLFETIDKRIYGQAWRALLRATENAERPLP